MFRLFHDWFRFDNRLWRGGDLRFRLPLLGGGLRLPVDLFLLRLRRDRRIWRPRLLRERLLPLWRGRRLISSMRIGMHWLLISRVWIAMHRRLISGLRIGMYWLLISGLRIGMYWLLISSVWIAMHRRLISGMRIAMGWMLISGLLIGITWCLLRMLPFSRLRRLHNRLRWRSEGLRGNGGRNGSRRNGFRYVAPIEQRIVLLLHFRRTMPREEHIVWLRRHTARAIGDFIFIIHPLAGEERFVGFAPHWVGKLFGNAFTARQRPAQNAGTAGFARRIACLLFVILILVFILLIINPCVIATGAVGGEGENIEDNAADFFSDGDP